MAKTNINKQEIFLQSTNLNLKILTPNDVTNSYIMWMNNAEIIEHLENKGNNNTKVKLTKYVKELLLKSDCYLFGIFLKRSNKHIGNIKIGSIHPIHLFADVGLLIGERSEWNKGYATEAIKIVTEFAFRKLHLNKTFATILAANLGSYKAFIKAGYTEAGRLKRHTLHKGKYEDTILVETHNQNFAKGGI